MSRPTPTHPRSVAFAIRIPGEGWAMDRNGELRDRATVHGLLVKIADLINSGGRDAV